MSALPESAQWSQAGLFKRARKAYETDVRREDGAIGTVARTMTAEAD